MQSVFDLPAIRDAFYTGAAVGVVCAILSCFLILKGWSLMGDAISHAVLPGIVLAYMAGWPLALGAFLAGMACATGTGWLKAHSRLKEDSALGVVFTGLFGLGMVLFSRANSDMHLDHILFGDILGILPEDKVQCITISSAVAVIVIAWRRDLLLWCMDPGHAQVIGLPVRVIHFGLLALLALTIVAAVQAAGVLLVIAMLITPGAVAFLLTDRFDRMLIISVAVSLTAVLGGIYISCLYALPSGACIVLSLAVMFILALAFAPRQGVWKRIPLQSGA